MNADTDVTEAARVYLVDPDDSASRGRFIAALLTMPTAAGDVVASGIACLAADERVDHERLSSVAVRRLVARPAVVEMLQRLRQRPGVPPTQLGIVAAELEDPLTLHLLADHLVASTEVEMIITALRAAWLDSVRSQAPLPWPPPGLLSAIALQMHTTEWVYAETESESARLVALAEHISRADTLPWNLLLVYAMYRPLGGLGLDERLMSVSDDRTAELLRRHLIEPAEERALASEMPRLTDIVDAVSQAVRSQYEERPYPRWRHVAGPSRRRFGEMVAAALGDAELAATIDFASPRILIAGCGTGRHAVMTAARYQGARVLAVDLSLASLAHGARQARRHGIGNIDFAQADILALSDRSFDVIESVGVLHHLADPEAGLAKLRRLLRPGGLMKLGLYSGRGRRLLDPVSELIEEQSLQPTLDGIRAVRSLVRAMPPGLPAHRLEASPDFFSRSGCRDLFFHEHEVRFDLARVQRALDALDLEFLGFELPSRVRELYRSRFPDDPSGRNLRNWDALERSQPLLFSAMYRFWVRAPDEVVRHGR